MPGTIVSATRVDTLPDALIDQPQPSAYQCNEQPGSERRCLHKCCSEEWRGYIHQIQAQADKTPPACQPTQLLHVSNASSGDATLLTIPTGGMALLQVACSYCLLIKI